MRKYVYPITALLFLTSSLMMALCVSPTAQAANTHTALTTTGPVASTWYFAEGRVGGGFLQWFTVSNPGNADCNVKIQYDYILDGASSGNIQTVSFTVPVNTRHTQSVNADLNISQGDSAAATLSAVVSVVNTSTCPGVVAERPMYFTNFHGTSSGTDVIGTATPASTWYFADVPRKSSGESFLSVLNPNDNEVSVTVTYYVGGSEHPETHMVAGHSRDTFQPNNAGFTAADPSVIVQATGGNIVVERPTYFINTQGVSGSADLIGLTHPNITTPNDYLFPEGNTGTGSVENLMLANFSGSQQTATITLYSTGGAVHTFSNIPVPANGQAFWSVNTHNTLADTTDVVSAEVSGIGIVAQRQVYSTHLDTTGTGWTAESVTDSLGTPCNQHLYNFAEGFTSSGFNESLMLVNKNSSAIHVSVTLVNMLSQIDTIGVTVDANSIYPLNVTSEVANASNFTHSDVRSYAVSMQVSSDNKAPFGAERVMYWNAFNTQGSSAVPGYAG